MSFDPFMKRLLSGGATRPIVPIGLANFPDQQIEDN
jgi:hypothetical protein